MYVQVVCIFRIYYSCISVYIRHEVFENNEYFHFCLIWNHISCEKLAVIYTAYYKKIDKVMQENRYRIHVSLTSSDDIGFACRRTLFKSDSPFLCMYLCMLFGVIFIAFSGMVVSVSLHKR